MAKKLTSTKARKILHDKEVHGQPLTDKQRRFFGAIAGGAKPYKAESGGWLDKYDAPKAQNGIEGTMGGLTDKGFNYNGAWGGPSMQDGGPITPMSRESYDALRKEYEEFYTPKVPYRPKEDDGFDAFYKYKTQDLAKVPRSQGPGWLIKSDESEMFVPSEKGAPMPKKVEKKAGKKTFVEDYVQMEENPLKQFYSDITLDFVKQAARNAGLPPYQRLQTGGNIMPAMAGANQTVPMAQLGDSVKPITMQLAMGGSIPGAVGFTYARTVGAAPSNGPYAKKTKASAQDGAMMRYYQQGLDFKPKTISQDGSEIPVDPEGYWNPENWGNPVIIPSNIITMEGVDQPLLGISDEGDVQYMEPGEDYEFEGEYVTEYPVAKKGISVNMADQNPNQKLDQLLNFTNYNKPTKGGWLDKYN